MAAAGAREGRIHTFEIVIDSKGAPISTSFHHRGFSGPAPSGLDSSDEFTVKTATAKLVEGRYRSVGEHEFFGDTYAFDVSFRAVVAPKGK